MLEETKVKMFRALEVLKADLATVRTGRATPSLVENIIAPCYGGTQKLKIKELSTVVSPDPANLTLTPFDQSIIGEIRNAILMANLGLSPIIDGNIIRIAVSPLTEEKRQEMVKLMRQKLEGGRIMIRQIRHDEMNQIKKRWLEKEISEEEKAHLEKELQNFTDEMIGEIKVMGERKEEELLSI